MTILLENVSAFGFGGGGWIIPPVLTFPLLFFAVNICQVKRWSTMSQHTHHGRAAAKVQHCDILFI